MKNIILFLLWPFFSLGQTVHVEDEQIAYKGSITVAGTSGDDLLARLQNAVQAAAKQSKGKTALQMADNRLVSLGAIQLNAPFHILRTVHFRLQMQANNSGYDFWLDSVSVVEKRRGGKETAKTSKELLEGMEETGNVAIATERLLNEIDLQLQKFLILTKDAVKFKSEQK